MAFNAAYTEPGEQRPSDNVLHRSDTFAWAQYLIDDDPRVFVIWEGESWNAMVDKNEKYCFTILGQKDRHLAYDIFNIFF